MGGKKIENLEILREHNFPVPEFFVVDRDTDIDAIKIPWNRCAVRSAACVEDGAAQSFAGQFDTFLNVSAHEVTDRIRQCFASTQRQSVREYAERQGIELTGIDMQVIVQKMINSRYSGVCFTANPQGLLNEMVIVVGRGTGDNVVEDKTKATTYYYHVTDRVYYYEGEEDFLCRDMLERLVKLAEDMQPLLGELLDIEFAVSEDEIYILQARNITTLRQDTPLILDNSNIVESYPGLSLPLTCSFVNTVYSGIFKSISRRVLKNERELAKYENVFSNMVGAVNGRLYYKISNWYTIIKFLPMNKKIIPIWQEMLGVKTKSYDRQPVKLPALVRAKTYWNVIVEMLCVPKNMRKLNRDFAGINESFYSRWHDEITPGEALALYRELQETLLSCWDITLLNDVYSFVFTALVKKRLGERGNQVISGISNIESMKPVRELLRLAWEKDRVSEEQYSQRFEVYIREYGDRNLEELKLESRTFRSNPELLEEQIALYREDPERLDEMYHRIQEEAKNAQRSVRLKGLNRFFAAQAARGIANREISRLNRSRIFGMVRSIFSGLGEEFARTGLIETPDDVFWMTTDEVFAAAEQYFPVGTSRSFDSGRCSASPDKEQLRAVISGRKAEYELYACLPAYQRLVFAGKEFDKHHRSINSHKLRLKREELTGTPCSDGIAEGEVLVVTDVTQVKNYKDKILVTRMTDPGWVFLLVCARGIISEKGSLLSHTAIISRELKLPSIVGVEKLTDTLQTGDVVRMNGSTGQIWIVKRNEDEMRQI